MNSCLRTAALACPLLFLLFCGCGDSRVAVRGQVTLDGKPLEQGQIAFVPEATMAAPSVGGDITNGQYQLAQPIELGTYSVEIRSYQKTGKRIAGLYGETEEQLQIVPDKYNKKTTLRFTRDNDPGRADFDLTLK